MVWYGIVPYHIVRYGMVRYHTIHMVPVLGLIMHARCRNVPELYVTLLDKLDPSEKCVQKGGKDGRPW